MHNLQTFYKKIDFAICINAIFLRQLCSKVHRLLAHNSAQKPDFINGHVVFRPPQFIFLRNCDVGTTSDDWTDLNRDELKINKMDIIICSHNLYYVLNGFLVLYRTGKKVMPGLLPCRIQQIVNVVLKTGSIFNPYCKIPKSVRYESELVLKCAAIWAQ